MRKIVLFLILIVFISSCIFLQPFQPSPTPVSLAPTALPLPTATAQPIELPTAIPQPSPAPAPLPATFLVSTARQASLFAGPGNLDFAVLAELPAGTRVTVLGAYADFLKVQVAFKSEQKIGFIWKNSFGPLPAAPYVLSTMQMPWQKLMDLQCFTSTGQNSLGKFSLKNPSNASQALSSYPFGLDKPLRLTVGFKGEHQVVWLIDSSEKDDKSKGRSLDILVRNGSYLIRIRKPGGQGWSVSYKGPAAGQSITVQFNDLHGRTFTVFDGGGRMAGTVDVTRLKTVHLPNGLFPEGNVSTGISIDPFSTLNLDNFLLEKLPTGAWHNRVDPGQSLAQLAKQDGITVGTEFILQNSIDPRYCSVMRKNFNVAVISDFSYQDIWKSPGSYDFSLLDQTVDYARAQGWRVRGFHLVWGADEMGVLPQWLLDGNYSRDELIAILEQHIKTMVGHFKGRVQEWSIANEAVNRMLPKGAPDFWNEKIGPEYIEMAFRWAHEADPDAVLIFNNYQNESPRDEDTTLAVNTLYTMVKDLKAKGVPLDVVGMEFHLLLPWGSPLPPTRQDMVTTMSRFAGLGVKVQVTELDVNVHDFPGYQRDKWKEQAAIYQDVAAACVESHACTSFSTWGISDIDSWVSCQEAYCQQILDADPLMFDKEFNPKPAYFAVQQAFMKGQNLSPTPTATLVP